MLYLTDKHNLTKSKTCHFTAFIENEKLTRSYFQIILIKLT